MKTIQIEIGAGENISNACKQAVATAIKEKCCVTFDFNGTSLKATPESTSKELLEEWREDSRKKREAYEKSPEFKRQQEKAEQDVRRNQNACDLAVATLHYAIKEGMDALMDWLYAYAKAADHIHVNSYPSTILNMLEQVGFEINAHVGKKPEWFSTRQRMGQYIMGQAMSCMKSGMPPHPVTFSFVEKYRKLPATPTVSSNG